MDDDILEIEVKGVKYRLGRVGFAVRLDAEEPVRAQRRLEFRRVLEIISGLSDPEKTQATITAFDSLLRNVSVSDQDIREFFASPRGELFVLLKSLQAVNPSATEEQARQLMNDRNEEQTYRITEFLALKLIG